MLQAVLIPKNPFVFSDKNFKTVKREMYVFKRLKLRFLNHICYIGSKTFTQLSL